jgi:hypothetical protein
VLERPPLGAHVLEGQRRLETTAHLELRTAEGSEVVGVRVRVLAREAAPAACIGEGCLPTQQHLKRMQRGGDQATARSQYASELGDRGVQLAEVRERKPADHEIEFPIVRRDAPQIPLDEARLRHFLRGTAQHLGAHVDANHLMPEPHQLPRVPTGAACRIQRPTRRNRRKQRPDHRLLESDERPKHRRRAAAAPRRGAGGRPRRSRRRGA